MTDEGVPAHSENGGAAGATVAQRPGFLASLTAPIWGMFTPKRAAACTASGPISAVLIGLALGATAFGAAIVSAVVWTETVSTYYVPGVAAQAASQPLNPTDPELSVISFAESWERGRQADGSNAYTWAGLSLAAAAIGVVVALGALRTADVLQGISLRTGYMIALRRVAPVIGAMVLCAVVIGMSVAVFDNASDRQLAAGVEVYRRGGPPFPEAIVISLIPFSLLLLLVGWTSRAVEDAIPRADAPAHAVEPVCDGCGYDLTHVPESGVCSECGLATHESLNFGERRKTCMWDVNPTRGQLIRTAVAIIARPAQFYSRLAIRPEQDGARLFGRTHLATMGVGAGVWITALLLSQDSAEVLIPMLPFAAAMTPLLGWLLLRGVTWISMVLWSLQADAGAMRALRRVMCFETAFLWVFCGYNGLMMTGMVTMNSAVQVLVRQLGPMLFTLLVPLMNLAIFLFWLRRWSIIRRAVRWANF